MIEEPNLIYTDGHDVKITSDRLEIRNSTYLINGITRAKMLIVRANKWIPFLLIILGIGLLILGYSHVLPPPAEQNVVLGQEGGIPTETMVEIVGGILAFVGLVWLVAA